MNWPVLFCQIAIWMLFTYSWLSNILNPGITIKAKANRHFIKLLSLSLHLLFRVKRDVEKGRKNHKQFCIIVREERKRNCGITPFLLRSLHLSRPTIPLTVNGPFFLRLNTHAHIHSHTLLHPHTHTPTHPHTHRHFYTHTAHSPFTHTH